MARERELNFKLNVRSVNAEALKQAFKSVTAELDKQKQRAEELKAALDPTLLRERIRLSQQEEQLRKRIAIETIKANTSQRNIRQQAALDLGKEAAQKRYDEALTKEKMRQKAKSYGGGVKGQIFAHLEGTKAGGILGQLTGNSRLATMSGMGGAMGAMAAAGAVIGGVVVAVGALAKAAKSFGGMASPATLERYNVAVADAQAVLGRVFVPLLEHMADAARLVGDALATVLPSTAEMRDAMEPFKEALQDLKEIFTDLAPAIKVAIKGMLAIQKVIWRIAMAVGMFQIRAAAAVAKATGMMPKNEKGLASSMGASTRKVEFMSLEQYAQSVYKAALAGGGAKTVEEQMATSLDALVKIAERIANAIGVGTEAAGKVVEGVSTATTVIGMVTNPGEAIRKAVLRGLQGM